MSKGKFNSVKKVVGGSNCREKDLLALITYIAEEDKVEKVLENQKIIKTPIVRNGKKAKVIRYDLLRRR